jgi:hypothetical protein
VARSFLCGYCCASQEVLDDEDVHVKARAVCVVPEKSRLGRRRRSRSIALVRSDLSFTCLTQGEQKSKLGTQTLHLPVTACIKHRQTVTGKENHKIVKDQDMAKGMGKYTRILTTLATETCYKDISG